MAIPILLALLAFAFAPGIVDNKMNKVAHVAKTPSAASVALHNDAYVADMHADSLLWGRDLTQRSQRGHLDLPRMRDGHVALQIFDVVTKTPEHLNIERNDDSTDNIKLLALAQGWPLRTRDNLLERALFVASRLPDELQLVREPADLETKKIAALIGLEGAHAIAKLDDVDTLHAAGFRLVGLSHFFDNAWAGSAHGAKKHGLTEPGKRLVAKLESKRILVDLAHASPATIDDVLAVAKRPVVVSHTGVRGTCDNARNLSDDQLKRIAATGGIVGIGFFSNAVCATSVAAIVKAMRHAVSVIGEDHVAMGSDFDGAVTTPFDVSQLVELTDALRSSGLSDAVVRKLLGENLHAFLTHHL